LCWSSFCETHTHKQIKQQDKKNLAAEQRAVGQEERREKEKKPNDTRAD
jgi:hypothetical protein